MYIVLHLAPVREPSEFPILWMWIMTVALRVTFSCDHPCVVVSMNVAGGQILAILPNVR